eukprot:gene5036-34823_t
MEDTRQLNVGVAKSAYAGDITSLCTIKLGSCTMVLGGCGPNLHVYDVQSSALLSSCFVFDGHRIHGTAALEDECGSDSCLVVVYAEPTSSLASAKPSSSLASAKPTLSSDSAIMLAVGVAGNAVELWRLKPQEAYHSQSQQAYHSQSQGRLVASWQLDLLMVSECSERLLLYSLKLRLLVVIQNQHGSCLEAGLGLDHGSAMAMPTSAGLAAVEIWVAAGTIFNEVLLWKAFTLPDYLFDNSLSSLLTSSYEHNGNKYGSEAYCLASRTAGIDSKLASLASRLSHVEKKARLSDSSAHAALMKETLAAHCELQAERRLLYSTAYLSTPGGDTGCDRRLEVLLVQPLYRLCGHEGSIFSLCWCASGIHLASVSDDRTLRVWALPEAIFGQQAEQDQEGRRDQQGQQGQQGWQSHQHLQDQGDQQGPPNGEPASDAGTNCMDGPGSVSGPQELRPLRTLFGHTSRVWDGHRGRGIWKCCTVGGSTASSVLVTAGADASIKLWALDSRLLSGPPSNRSNQNPGPPSNRPNQKQKRSTACASDSIPIAVGGDGSSHRDELQQQHVINLPNKTQDATDDVLAEGKTQAGDLLHPRDSNDKSDKKGASKAAAPKRVDWVRCMAFGGSLETLYVAANSGAVHRLTLTSPPDEGLWEELHRSPSGGPWTCIAVLPLSASTSGGPSPPPLACDIVLLGHHKGLAAAVVPGMGVTEWQAHSTAVLSAFWFPEFGQRLCATTDARRISSMDACPNHRVLMAGDQDGNVFAFSLPQRLVALSNRSSSARSAGVVQLGPTSQAVALPVLATFPGSMGDTAGVHARVVLTGSKRIPGIVAILDFDNEESWKDRASSYSHYGQSSDRIVAGFQASEFVVYSTSQQAEVMRFNSGGWKRAHCFSSHAQGTLAFAYHANDTLHVLATRPGGTSSLEPDAGLDPLATSQIRSQGTVEGGGGLVLEKVGGGGGGGGSAGGDRAHNSVMHLTYHGREIQDTLVLPGPRFYAASGVDASGVVSSSTPRSSSSGRLYQSCCVVTSSEGGAIRMLVHSSAISQCQVPTRSCLEIAGCGNGNGNRNGNGSGSENPSGSGIATEAGAGTGTGGKVMREAIARDSNALPSCGGGDVDGGGGVGGGDQVMSEATALGSHVLPSCGGGEGGDGGDLVFSQSSEVGDHLGASVRSLDWCHMPFQHNDPEQGDKFLMVSAGARVSLKLWDLAWRLPHPDTPLQQPSVQQRWLTTCNPGIFKPHGLAAQTNFASALADLRFMSVSLLGFDTGGGEAQEGETGHDSLVAPVLLAASMSDCTLQLMRYNPPGMMLEPQWSVHAKLGWILVSGTSGGDVSFWYIPHTASGPCHETPVHQVQGLHQSGVNSLASAWLDAPACRQLIVLSGGDDQSVAVIHLQVEVLQASQDSGNFQKPRLRTLSVSKIANAHSTAVRDVALLLLPQTVGVCASTHSEDTGVCVPLVGVGTTTTTQCMGAAVVVPAGTGAAQATGECKQEGAEPSAGPREQKGAKPSTRLQTQEGAQAAASACEQPVAAPVLAFSTGLDQRVHCWRLCQGPSTQFVKQQQQQQISQSIAKDSDAHSKLRMELEDMNGFGRGLEFSSGEEEEEERPASSHQVKMESGAGDEGQEINKKLTPWSKQEDNELRLLVEDHGAKNWHLIAAHITGRAPKSCRLRWINHLAEGLRTGPFTPEEDALVIDGQARLGNKWNSALRKRIEGVSENKQRQQSQRRPRRVSASTHQPQQQQGADALGALPTGPDYPPLDTNMAAAEAAGESDSATAVQHGVPAYLQHALAASMQQMIREQSSSEMDVSMPMSVAMSMPMPLMTFLPQLSSEEAAAAPSSNDLMLMPAPVTVVGSSSQVAGTTPPTMMGLCGARYPSSGYLSASDIFQVPHTHAGAPLGALGGPATVCKTELDLPQLDSLCTSADPDNDLQAMLKHGTSLASLPAWNQGHASVASPPATRMKDLSSMSVLCELLGEDSQCPVDGDELESGPMGRAEDGQQLELHTNKPQEGAEGQSNPKRQKIVRSPTMDNMLVQGMDKTFDNDSGASLGCEAAECVVEAPAPPPLAQNPSDSNFLSYLLGNGLASSSQWASDPNLASTLGLPNLPGLPSLPVPSDSYALDVTTARPYMLLPTEPMRMSPPASQCEQRSVPNTWMSTMQTDGNPGAARASQPAVAPNTAENTQVMAMAARLHSQSRISRECFDLLVKGGDEALCLLLTLGTQTLMNEYCRQRQVGLSQTQAAGGAMAPAQSTDMRPSAPTPTPSAMLAYGTSYPEEVQGILNRQPGQDMQGFMNRQPGQDMQGVLDSQPGQDMQGFMNRRPGQDMQDLMNRQPEQDMRGFMNRQPEQDMQGFMNRQPGQHMQGVLDRQPGQDMQGFMNRQPGQDMQGVLDRQPGQGMQGFMNRQPGQHMQGVLDRQPGQDMQGFMNRQPGQDMQGVLDSQPGQDMQGFMNRQPGQDMQGILDKQPAVFVGSGEFGLKDFLNSSDMLDVW